MKISNRSIKVSVIVPVYNVEKYIDECLASIINQTLKDIEIIIINDGSTDTSFEICTRYAEFDNRIELVNQENKGLGPARNRGLSLARGEYLSFIDSDDYIEESFLEDLYNQAVDSGADVVVGVYCLYYESSKKILYRTNRVGAIKIKLDDCQIENFLREYWCNCTYASYAYDKIYKRNYVKQNNVLFGNNQKIFAEDRWFQLQILRGFPTILFSESAYYVYRQRATSLMNAPKKKILKRSMTMCKDYLDLIRQDKKYETEENLVDLLAEESIVQCVTNHIKFGGHWSNFMNDMQAFLTDNLMIERTTNLYTNKSYRLAAPGRRLFTQAIGFLFYEKKYKMACRLYWLIYKLKLKQRREC